MKSSIYSIIGAVILSMGQISIGNTEEDAIPNLKQEFYVRNNEVIKMFLSQKELNRVHFTGEKVESLHYTEGEMEYNPVDSDLYVKVRVNKPINFFVKLESGKTYQILVEVRDVPSSQIFINPMSKKLVNKGHARRKKKESNAVEKSASMLKSYVLTDYEEKINKIIKVTQVEKDHMGYKLSKVEKKLVLKKHEFPNIHRSQISIFEKLNVKGKGFIAHKLVINNRSAEQIELTGSIFERNFSKVVANYIEKEKLPAGENAVIIIVSKYD